MNSNTGIGNQHFPMSPYAPQQQNPTQGGNSLNHPALASAILVHLLAKYPEAEKIIKDRVDELGERGFNIPQIEQVVSDEIDKLGPSILKERENRKNLIMDPKTRNRVQPPFTIEEQNLIDDLRRAEEAESKNKSGICFFFKDKAIGLFTKKK